MGDLHVTLGAGARTALCGAFDAAAHRIEAQFHSIGDEAVLRSLNRAAQRGVDVTIHVEGDRGRYGHQGPRTPNAAHVRESAAAYLRALDPRVHVLVEADDLVLEHAKAAVVDGTRAFVGTANPNDSGFSQPGAVLVEDDAYDDVAAIQDLIEGRAGVSARVVSGPDTSARARIESLLDCPAPAHVAIEDLSDPEILRRLAERRQRGLHDEVLVKCERGTNTLALRCLAAAGVAIRTLPHAYLHDKYIDAGDRIYIGSANLTRNGLDEAREVGIIAEASDYADGAAALRADFDRMWASAVPL